VLSVGPVQVSVHSAAEAAVGRMREAKTAASASVLRCLLAPDQFRTFPPRCPAFTNSSDQRWYWNGRVRGMAANRVSVRCERKGGATDGCPPQPLRLTGTD
jgi:hypothetical protein